MFIFDDIMSLFNKEELKMSKSWLINYGVNKSHTTEFYKDKENKKIFDKKRDALSAWNEINFEEYKNKGFNYFCLVSLHFSKGQFKICEKREILKENFL